MNKNFKVVQIQGLSGLLLLGFVVVGIICGFVLFPIWIIMVGWNELSVSVFSGPAINYYQASLLWIFLVLSAYLLLRNSISVKVEKPDSVDDSEIEKIINENIETTEKNESEL